MTSIRVLALCAAMALVLSACNEGADEPVDVKAPASTMAQGQKAQDTAKLPAEPGPGSLVAAEVSDKAVTVGTSLANDRAVKSAQAQFTTSDTVYASASVRGKPGASVTVYWTYQDGTTHKEETRELKSGGTQPVAFSFAQGDGMIPGKYNVQIDEDMIPVGIADFVVK